MLENIRIPRRLSVLLAVAASLAVACNEPQKVAKPTATPRDEPRTAAQDNDLVSHQVVQENGRTGMRVNPGTPDKAREYFNNIRRDNLKSFPVDVMYPSSDLDTLLRYVGQGEHVTARELEDLSSTELANKGYLATRFFAPKIVNVADPGAGGRYGWRKLVRLEVRSGSGAHTDGMGALWVLFNYLSDPPSFPPAKAGAIQAILQRADSRSDGLPVYFFVYGKQSDNYPIGLSLSASFDAPNNNDGNKEYYIPQACAECHGIKSTDTSMAKTKINYLDTDHWFDRIQGGDDFSGLPPASVLPDGGEPGAPGFAAAFQTIRSLNETIRDQNRIVGGTGNDNFQLRAVSKWLAVHEPSPQHVPPFGRAIGDAPWQDSSPLDHKLLPLLNRYCFRCHSSLAYHVFDKPAVKALTVSGMMKSYVQSGFMPQDRRLDGATKQEFVDLLDELARQ